MGRVLQTTRGVGLVLAAWAVPSLVLAAPVPQAAVRVEIDVSAVEAIDAFDAGGIEKSVRARTEKLLEDEGWFMDDAAKDAIVVRVEYVDKEDLEYGIHIHVYDDGEEVQPGEEWIVCKYCSHALVGERYAERLPAVLGRLAGANARKATAVAEPVTGNGAEAEVEPEQDQPPAVDGEPKPGPRTADANPRPMGWLGITGVVVAAGGLGMGAFGVARVVRGVEVRGADAEYSKTYDYPAQGRVFVGLGTTAVVLGTVALVTDVVLRRRSRHGVAARPSASATSVGLSISGRF